MGGTVGTGHDDDEGGTGPNAFIDADGVPYGSVFGGSRGQAAKDVDSSPRYKYVPDLFVGYVNNTAINIGGTTASGPKEGAGPIIKGSIYGGGQDGHVRNNTEVKVFKGNVSGQEAEKDPVARTGHVFGAGSGIGRYTDGGSYCSGSSGSVIGSTLIEVSGGTTTTLIAHNVYGGGALASVGAPKVDQDKNEQKVASEDHKSYSCNTVNIKGGSIGGSVYGASRGPGVAFLESAFTHWLPPLCQLSAQYH